MKRTHSIRIDDEVWKESKASDLNVSQHIEKSLRLVSTNKKAKIMKELSHCSLCGKAKDITDFWGCNITQDDGRHYVSLFCDDCLNNTLERRKEIEQVKANSKNLGVKILLLYYDKNILWDSDGLILFFNLASNHNFLYFEFGRGYFLTPLPDKMDDMREKSAINE